MAVDLSVTTTTIILVTNTHLFIHKYHLHLIIHSRYVNILYVVNHLLNLLRACYRLLLGTTIHHQLLLHHHHHCHQNHLQPFQVTIYCHNQNQCQRKDNMHYVSFTQSLASLFVRSMSVVAKTFMAFFLLSPETR